MQVGIFVDRANIRGSAGRVSIIPSDNLNGTPAQGRAQTFLCAREGRYAVYQLCANQGRR